VTVSKIPSPVRCAVQADPLPGAELDGQHADLGRRPVKSVFQRVPGGGRACQQNLTIACGAGEAYATGDQRCPDPAVLIVACDHDERLPAEELGKLGRDEGADHAADLSRHPLGAGPPLQGAFALVEQCAHTARRRGPGGDGGAR
jgi:hypothetical protein